MTIISASSGKEVFLEMEIREGYMPFKEYKTYYRIVGKKTGNKKPLVPHIIILKCWTASLKKTVGSLSCMTRSAAASLT